jgi:hypothetical protein
VTSIHRLSDPTNPNLTGPAPDLVVGDQLETAERSTIVVTALSGRAVHPSSTTGRGPRLDVPSVTAARPRRRRMTLVAVPLALVAGLAFSACGSDDDSSSAATTAPLPGAVTSTTVAVIDEVEVHAIDFAFTGLPEKVPAGTRLKFVNDAETEVHELVAFRLPEGEERSVEEILELPEDEAEALMGGGPPALVIMAAPGGEEIHAVGDGVLSEPGRYLIMCSVPEGSDASILDSDAPPSSDLPPHFAHGMHAELLVE